MAEQRIKKVVIAGGGTAGWIAAAALARSLGPLLQITLVESDEIGTVGVGEATIPTHRTFHNFLGIDEKEFMAETQATFKLAIAFENWARLGDRYIHSFGEVGRGTWVADFHHIWLQGREEGVAEDIGEYCFELKAAEAGKFYTSDKSPLSYAYHLDAGLYAKYLRRLAEEKGATRIEGKIASVERDGSSGDIAAIVLESGQRIDGDLFIDCTGFRALLMEQTLETGYEDWSDWLFTDSAFAVQTRAVRDPVPYTRAIAHDAGWQWRIPLQHRVGNGLIYCSEDLEADTARQRLLDNVEGETITEPRLIRYKTGRRKQVWNRNCVALGLSSGFLEPLESTSIHLIQLGITKLIQMFPFAGITAGLRDRYNRQAQDNLEHIRDFLILHYKLTERDDSPFWRRCRDMEIPDTLQTRIDLFREQAMVWKEQDDLFQIDSWLQVMLGQRLEPVGHHHLGRLMNRDQLGRSLVSMQSQIADAVAKLPTHRQFLERYCPAPKP